MKRFILMAAAAALLAIPAAEAQKVNKEATLSKLEKSDADIANPKKNAKAATAGSITTPQRNRRPTCSLRWRRRC